MGIFSWLQKSGFAMNDRISNAFKISGYQWRTIIGRFQCSKAKSLDVHSVRIFDVWHDDSDSTSL